MSWEAIGLGTIVVIICSVLIWLYEREMDKDGRGWIHKPHILKERYRREQGYDKTGRRIG